MKALIFILSKSRYFAPAWVFASLNILIGTWALYIPRVKEKTGLSDGDLGFTLLFFALGTMVVMPITPLLIRKLTLGKATFIGIVCKTLCFVLLFVSPTQWTLALSLFLLGFTSGFTDISMNTLVAEIEKEDDVSFMSASHGFFSLGGVIAVALGSIVAFVKLPFWGHIVSVVVLVLFTNLLLHKNYWENKGAVHEKGRFRPKNLWPMLPLGVMAFIIMGSEGAVVDWSSLYLKNVSLAPVDQIGWGFGLFSLTMTIGRFFGDGLSERFSGLAIITIGGITGVLGYLCILTTNPSLTILGFGLVGLGFSVIIPELFRLAGRVKGVKSSEGITFVAGIGYIGFLLTPPVLGYLADRSSLRLSFLALLFGAIIAIILALGLRRK